MKKTVKVIVIMIAVFAVIFAILYSSCDAYIFRGNKIRAEVISYVLENNDTIELDNVRSGTQHFLYTYIGLIDARIDYGYYYSEDDEYDRPPGAIGEMYVYKSGYRSDGVYTDRTDWYYTEKICDHWYYYEIHDA